MNKLDLNKPVQTRNGLPARILTTDSKMVVHDSEQPIVAEILNGYAHYQIETYSIDGRFHPNISDHPLDLVNVPEPKQYREWTLDETPVGGVVRVKDVPGSSRLLILWAADDCMVTLSTCKGNSCGVGHGVGMDIHSSSLLKTYEYTPDGGKTWGPCGVLE